jgi:hypothetical protein
MVLTFQKILAGCVAGQPEAWRAFLGETTPIAFELFGVYLPWSAEARRDFWREALRALSANSFERLRAFPHQAEREFLVELRAFLLERAQPLLGSEQNFLPGPAPTTQSLTRLLQGLPLLHQEIIFLKLAGYSDATLEDLLRVSPGVAQAGLERLRGEYGGALGRSEDRCPWPAAWLAVIGEARAARQQDCPPLRLMIRVLDGQTSWYEKDPVEQHRTGCLSCLEQWTSLLEVMGWMKRAKGWSDSQLNDVVSVIDLQKGNRQRVPLLKKVFG